MTESVIVSTWPMYVIIADRDPTSVEPILTDYENQIIMCRWLNTTTKDQFTCVEGSTYNNLVWDKIITDRNINQFTA